MEEEKMTDQNINQIYDAFHAARERLLIMDNVHIIIGSVLTALSVLVLVGLLVFVLVANKKARGMGIIATVLYSLGLLTGWGTVLTVTIMHKTVLFDYFSYILPGFVIMLEMGRIEGENVLKLFLQFFGDTWYFLLITAVLSVFFYLGSVMMTVYSGKQMKAAKKGFAVTAFILLLGSLVLQFLGFYFPVFTLWPQQTVQLVWTVIYNGIYTLPALLLAIQSIFVIVDNRKKRAEELANTVEISDIEEL